ncbi:conserved hypothetical protein [Neospora caninum Liverpool]|uniref:Peptidylprolyl isomerase n=1 Tax=Neospora caninum (strain Liverpool) TaxID=572307 RepID=F0VA87_NEOCL|nr:conserved hypothetical protein [Neospora caninum Liverpool]CBZ50576.1 conserved hypothetical protein [Neospora caninum Liverpool]CEL65189.1 TPA: hypothetical protein BN1204_010450 [Neospora caninum Liverpool]|eukprot:XP_003880609.1 conserved hypothetical protein [Neospora caninum Liverpool]
MRALFRLLATLLCCVPVGHCWAAPPPAVFPRLRDDVSSGEFVNLTREEEEGEFSVRVLKESSSRCGLRLNDWAEIRMRSFAPGVKILPHLFENKEFGHALQGFEVGKHNVTPLNRGIIGMCVGEIRRVGIKIGNMGKIFYEVTLENFKRIHRKTPRTKDEL